jgi:molecular chaperone GrpE
MSACAARTFTIAERTAEEARQYAIWDFARELLMVADNLERTIAAAAERTETVEDDALIEGVRATKRLLEQTLSHFGVRKIEALGKRFDPSLHEAVMEVDDPSQPPGTRPVTASCVLSGLRQFAAIDG